MSLKAWLGHTAFFQNEEPAIYDPSNIGENRIQYDPKSLPCAYVLRNSQQFEEPTHL